MNRILVTFILLFVSAICFSGERDESEILNVHETDVEMNAAMLHANQSLNVFVERFKNPQTGDSDFSLKVMVSDDYGVEHFWVTDVALTEKGFEGIIANEAKTVKLVDIGHKVNFGSDLVTDWSYNHKGVKQGAFTLKVLLSRMPKEQADYYKNAVGWK